MAKKIPAIIGERGRGKTGSVRETEKKREILDNKMKIYAQTDASLLKPPFQQMSENKYIFSQMSLSQKIRIILRTQKL